MKIHVPLFEAFISGKNKTGSFTYTLHDSDIEESTEGMGDSDIDVTVEYEQEPYDKGDFYTAPSGGGYSIVSVKDEAGNDVIPPAGSPLWNDEKLAAKYSSWKAEIEDTLNNGDIDTDDEPNYEED